MQRRTAQRVDEALPLDRVPNLLRERRAQHDGTSVGPDLAGGRDHAVVLVRLDVLVVPGALTLTEGSAGRGERGGHETAEHRVLVEERRLRVEEREQPLGDGRLPGAGRAGDDPGVGERRSRLRAQSRPLNARLAMRRSSAVSGSGAAGSTPSRRSRVRIATFERTRATYSRASDPRSPPDPYISANATSGSS